MQILIEATLEKIEFEMQRLYWNRNQTHMESPFRNTGQQYINDTFEVRAYYWGDDEEKLELPNFVYKDLSVWWYKHCGRGVEWMYKGERNGVVPSEFLAEMIDDCITSVSIDWDTI